MSLFRKPKKRGSGKAPSVAVARPEATGTAQRAPSRPSVASRREALTERSGAVIVAKGRAEARKGRDPFQSQSSRPFAVAGDCADKSNLDGDSMPVIPLGKQVLLGQAWLVRLDCGHTGFCWIADGVNSKRPAAGKRVYCPVCQKRLRAFSVQPMGKNWCLDFETGRIAQRENSGPVR